jgi:hypothetical protein
MTPDEALDRLHRAGWSIGETAAGRIWLVCGTNGENPNESRRLDPGDGLAGCLRAGRRRWYAGSPQARRRRPWCATKRDEGMDERTKCTVDPLALQEAGASLGRSCRWMQAGGEIAGPERYW